MITPGKTAGGKRHGSAGATVHGRTKGQPKLRSERDPRQGGGKFTRTAPAVRRTRRRKANLIAKASRRANR